MKAEQPSTVRSFAPLAALLFLSFLGKAAFRLWFSSPATYWKSGYSMYHRMAVGLLESGELTYGGGTGGGYPCFRLPAYPAFVAAISWLTNDAPRPFIVCQALVSTVTVALIYWITRHFASSRAAIASAALYALFPYAFVHETQLQENGLYNALSTLGLALFLWGLDQPRAYLWLMMAGLASGAAILTRGSHLVPALILPIALWIASRRSRWETSLLSASLLLGISVAVVPWMFRNYSVSGRFALTSQSGISLCVAHNPSTFDYFPYRGTIDQSWGAFHDSRSAEVRQFVAEVVQDEFKASDYYRQEAFKYIREHPFETLRRGFVKVFVNFAGVLSPLADPIKNWSYFLSFWGLTIFAMVGLMRLRGTSFSTVFWGLMFAQAGFSFVYYAHTSHRSYLDPILAAPAGIGFTLLESRIRKRRESTTANPADCVVRQS